MMVLSGKSPDEAGRWDGAGAAPPTTAFGMDSPVGPLSIAVGSDGSVTHVWFRETAGPSLRSAHRSLGEALDRYFDEGTDLKRVPVSLEVGEFQGAVLGALKAIPLGQTRTYAQVARSIGRPGASRAVGRACATNPIPLFIPCHRVLGSSNLGGYQNGLDSKLYLLRREGALQVVGTGVSAAG